MEKFLKLVKQLVKEYEITVKIEWSSHRCWLVEVLEKGYDRPFIHVEGEDMDDVFSRAFLSLYSNYE